MSGFSPVLDGQRPVFIVGHPRSGTTLAQQLLSAHPDIWSGPETHLYTHVLEGVAQWDTRSINRAELPQIVRRLGGKPGIELSAAARGTLDTLADRGDLGAARLLDVVMSDLKPADSTASRWLEKTPRHVYHIDAILRLFPDARIIHVLRDPRDVASSPVRFRELEPGLERSVLVLERGHRWNDVVALTDALASETRMITVRYEDLIGDTERVLEAMMQHAGLLTDLTVLDRFSDTYAQVTIEREGVRKQLNSAGKIVDRRGIYRQRMAAEEIVIIDTVCRDAMRAKGYVPDNAPDDALVTRIQHERDARRPKPAAPSAIERVKRSGKWVLSKLGLRPAKRR